MNISKLFKIHSKLLIILIIPIVSFSFAFFTLGDYGINWDEPYHYRRGQAFLHYFLTGNKTYDGIPKYPPLKGTTDTPNFRGSDEYFINTQENPNLSDPAYRRSYYQDDAWDGTFFIDEEKSYGHPALNDVFASFFNYIFYQKLGILGDIESYHLFIISTVAFASIFIAIFIWKEFGILESIFSSLSLATYPLLLGEQHFNIKDPVQMSFYAISVISVYLGIRKNRLIWFLVSAIFFGFALSTKFNILFSIIFLTPWFLYYIFNNKSKLKERKLVKNLSLAAIISPIIILSILFLFYPTLWRDPLNEVFQIIKFYLDVGFSQSQPSTYYIGFLNSYPIIWILYTTPPIALLLFLFGLIKLKEINKERWFASLALLWLLVTIGRISLFGATSYGGVRLIMEFIPPLAILTGISAGYLVKSFTAKYRSLLVIVLLLGFLPTIIKLVQIHPNQNVYFNLLAGGLKGASEKGLNSWGNSYGNAYYPAILWINENIERDSKLTIPVNSTVNIPRYKLRKDIAVSNTYWSGPEHKGEYVIELTHDYIPMQWFSLKYLNTVMEPVHEVKVEGVPIAKVWKNDNEHVKPQYKNTEIINIKLESDKNTITLKLPSAKKLLNISLTIPTQNCSPVKTGFAMTSVDDLTWDREIEDIARDQLKQAKLRDFDPKFDYYFVYKEAKTIVFESENIDACLLKANSAKAVVLKEN